MVKNYGLHKLILFSFIPIKHRRILCCISSQTEWAFCSSFTAQAFPGGMFPGGSQACYTTTGMGNLDLDKSSFIIIANYICRSFILGKPGGECVQDDCCDGGAYISNLCANYQNNVKCCYSRNSCTTSCGM